MKLVLVVKIRRAKIYFKKHRKLTPEAAVLNNVPWYTISQAMVKQKKKQKRVKAQYPFTGVSGS